MFLFSPLLGRRIGDDPNWMILSWMPPGSGLEAVLRLHRRRVGRHWSRQPRAGVRGSRPRRAHARRGRCPVPPLESSLVRQCTRIVPGRLNNCDTAPKSPNVATRRWKRSLCCCILHAKQGHRYERISVCAIITHMHMARVGRLTLRLWGSREGTASAHLAYQVLTDIRALFPGAVALLSAAGITADSYQAAIAACKSTSTGEAALSQMRCSGYMFPKVKFDWYFFRWVETTN